MEHARDRRAGRLIGTHEAVSGRFYTCPVCSAEVFLRRGRKYLHHFAHRSGRGKSECELFHPSDDIGYTWTRFSNPSGGVAGSRAISPLSLNIQLEPEALVRGKRLRRWSLGLTVPKSYDEHGKVTVDFGGGVTKTFALSRLSLESQTFPADLEAQEFGASWISPEVRQEYRNAIDERIPGLDRTLINSFAPSAQKYKQRTDSLSWGGSFYFVWYQDCVGEFHRNLSLLPLDTQNEWRCALVTLPDEEDVELKAWLDEYAGLSFTQQKRTFGIIFPAPCGIDIFGRPLVPPIGTFLLGLNLGHTDNGSGNKFSCSYGSETVSVSISDHGRHLFEANVNLGKNGLSLHLDDTPLPALAALNDASGVPFSEVILELRAREGTGTEHARFHQRSANAILRKVRGGGWDIAGISYPSRVGAYLRWRVPPTLDWLEFMLPSDSGVQAVSKANESEIAQFNSIFCNQSFDVQFDCGTFGVFYDSAIPSVARDEAILAISAQMRRRMIWVCKSAHLFTDELKTPVDRLSDTALAALFSSLRVKPELLAHKAAVVRALGRLQTATERV